MNIRQVTDNKIEFLVGITISAAAKSAIDLANSKQKTYTFEFNDHTLIANPGENPIDIAEEYKHLCEEASKAYWTPERVAEQADKEIADQAALDSHMKALYDVDFENMNAICIWLCGFESRKFVHTKLDNRKLLNYFTSHGFKSDVYCDNEFVAGDKNIEYRWLIGQALDGIQTSGIPHQLIHKFTKEFREKYE